VAGDIQCSAHATDGLSSVVAALLCMVASVWELHLDAAKRRPLLRFRAGARDGSRRKKTTVLFGEPSRSELLTQKGKGGVV